VPITSLIQWAMIAGAQTLAGAKWTTAAGEIIKRIPMDGESTKKTREKIRVCASRGRGVRCATGGRIANTPTAIQVKRVGTTEVGAVAVMV